MKKTIVLALAMMMTCGAMQAQDGYYDKKHEVGITYGFGSTSQIVDVFEDAIISMVDVRLSDESWVGPITAEYYYHPKNWLGVGGILGYGQMSQDVYLNGKHNGKDGDLKNSYLTLMPAVKFDYVRTKHFGMYSKLAFGATLRTEKVDYNDDKDLKDFNESEFHINWQVSLLGLEAGGQSLRGFMELGMGEQGIYVIGVKYRF
jgi:hypothetical protein